MKTFDGYSKEKFSDTSVLLAGGGSKELSNFIGTLNWDSTNRKLQYKKIGDTNWSDLVTFGSNATNSTAYLPLAGGTMTGAITRYYSAASSDPMIALTSNNLDVWLWKINSNSAVSTSTSASHGFGLKYIGTGDGNANNLVLYADNQTGSQVAAMTVDQSGAFTFANTVKATTFSGSLSGNASSATKLTSSAGSAVLPIYFSDGKPIACTAYSELLTALSSSLNTNLSITVGGTTKSITDLYSGYLKIHDIRDTAHAPNSTYYPEKLITAWFNNTGTPTSGWHSGIHVKGWTNNYSSWLICSYSDIDTSDNYHLYFRKGVNDSWGSWKTILDSSNYSSYVLPLSGGTITGNLTVEGNSIFKGSNEYSAIVTDGGANLVFDTLNNLVFTGNANLLLMTLKNGGTSYGAITAVPEEPTGLYYNNHKLLTANDAFINLFSTSEYLINITIGDITKKLTSSTIKTNLGLGLLAFKNSLTYSDVGAAANNHTHNYHGLNNKIIRAGGSYSWYNIQQYNSNNSNPSYYIADCAIININSYTGWQPWIRAVDSEYGSWVLGLYTNLLHIGRIIKTNTSNELTYTWTFGNSGNLTISGSYYANSDIRYKNILKYCNYNAKDIAQLPIFLYTWKNKNDNIVHIGSSAQDVFKIIPELVTYNSNEDFYNLNYSTLGTIVGITACKELVTLKSEIEQLRERVAELEQKLNDYGIL